LSRAPRIVMDSTDSLDLMPRSVRDKLDRVGIKLHLKQWQLLALAERHRLCDLACTTDAEVRDYRSEVERLVLQATGRPAERLARRPET